MDAQKETDKFKSAYAEMLATLTTPGFIPVLCAHEAAHAIYFTIVGMKSFETLPATIRYDPILDDYTGHLAAIQILDIPPWTEGSFWDWFFKVACGYAAGGVVSRMLMPSSDGGDQDDRDTFKALCETIMKNDPTVRIDAERTWKQAQDAVTDELRLNPAILSEIQQYADTLRPQFGL